MRIDPDKPGWFDLVFNGAGEDRAMVLVARLGSLAILFVTLLGVLDMVLR